MQLHTKHVNHNPVCLQIVGRNVEVKKVVESAITESNRVTLLHGPIGLGKEAIICAAQEKIAQAHHVVHKITFSGDFLSDCDLQLTAMYELGSGRCLMLLC